MSNRTNTINKSKLPLPTYNLYNDLKLEQYLLIPFNKKDELKKQYRDLKWDDKRKLWYLEDNTKWNMLPSYHIKYYDVPYDQKDAIKSSGFKWDALNKYWYGCDYLFYNLPDNIAIHIEEIGILPNRQKLNSQLSEMVAEPSNDEEETV